MKTKMTCIICPTGCCLITELKNGTVGVSGHKCLRGLEYAKQETLDPRRYLTASVAAYNLDLAMVPVKSEKPLPKSALLPAMEQIKKFRLNKSVKIGTVLIPDLAGTGIALVVTRNANRV